MSLGIILALLFNTTLVGICSFAFFRGGRPERCGAAINVVASVVSSVLRFSDAARLAPADVIIMSIDFGVALGFYWLGVTTTRFWPIWAAGFALGDLFMSALGALLPGIPLFAYHTGLGIYAYLALGALALGTFRLPRDAEPYIRNGSRRLWVQHLKETT